MMITIRKLAAVDMVLIDKYKLFVHPAIMRSVKRFFKDGMGITKLKLVESKTPSLGAVLLCHVPAK